MLYDYLEEYIPELEDYCQNAVESFRNLSDRIRNLAAPLVFGATLFYGTLDLKSDMDIERVPVSKGYIVSNLSNNLENISRDNISIEPLIGYIASLDDGVFSDNEFYKSIRMNEARRQLSLYDPQSDAIIIDKTFQKALFFKKTDNGYDFVDEHDCGTAKVYGKKIRPGDGKTPEGMFTIYSVEPAHNKLWDGEKAYGAYFLRIQGSIGMHGNGTDKVKNPLWMNDPAYMEPDPLGVYKENFGYGPSHGCVRVENDVVREKVEDGSIKQGDKVIIYENNNMTRILNDVYR